MLLMLLLLLLLMSLLMMMMMMMMMLCLGEVIVDVSPFSGIFSFVTEDGDASTSVALLEAGVEDSFLDSDSIVGPALSDISSEMGDI